MKTPKSNTKPTRTAKKAKSTTKKPTRRATKAKSIAKIDFPERWRVVENLVGMIESAFGTNAKVTRNVVIPIFVGEEPRQIDVFVEVLHQGATRRIAIEVRDHNRPLDLPALDGQHSKWLDIGTDEYRIVSVGGFSESARAKAQRVGIRVVPMPEVGPGKWEAGLIHTHWRLSHPTFVWKAEIGSPSFLKDIADNDVVVEVLDSAGNTFTLQSWIVERAKEAMAPRTGRGGSDDYRIDPAPLGWKSFVLRGEVFPMCEQVHITLRYWTTHSSPPVARFMHDLGLRAEAFTWEQDGQLMQASTTFQSIEGGGEHIQMRTEPVMKPETEVPHWKSIFAGRPPKE